MQTSFCSWLQEICLDEDIFPRKLKHIKLTYSKRIEICIGLEKHAYFILPWSQMQNNWLTLKQSLHYVDWRDTMNDEVSKLSKRVKGASFVFLFFLVNKCR